MHIINICRSRQALQKLLSLKFSGNFIKIFNKGKLVIWLIMTINTTFCNSPMLESRTLLEWKHTSRFVKMEERLPSTLVFFHVEAFLDEFKRLLQKQKKYPQEKCSSRTILVHVTWGNAKINFALQKYSFEEYPISFVWTDVVYFARIGHEIWYKSFLLRCMKTHFLRRNKMYQCRVLEEGRLNSYGNHSMVHLEPLLSGRHTFPPQREPKTI